MFSLMTRCAQNVWLIIASSGHTAQDLFKSRDLDCLCLPTCDFEGRAYVQKTNSYFSTILMFFWKGHRSLCRPSGGGTNAWVEPSSVGGLFFTSRALS